MDWSTSKVMRIESGTVAVSTNDLRALLRHYHVDSGAVTTMVEAAREVEKPDGGFRPGAGIQAAYLQNESIAARIRQYEPLLIPVLLQTEEYLRAAAADTLRREGAELEWLVGAPAATPAAAHPGGPCAAVVRPGRGGAAPAGRPPRHDGPAVGAPGRSRRPAGHLDPGGAVRRGRVHRAARGRSC